MTFEKIEELAEYIPSNSSYFQFDDPSLPGAATSNREDVTKFVVCYEKLDFGWAFIKALIEKGRPLPAEALDDDVLFRAYCYEKKVGKKDREMRHAVSLAYMAHSIRTDVINGMLVSNDADYEKIGHLTGISSEVIRLYEQLFYNVLDRRKESMWIASMVYPDGRAVDFVDGSVMGRHIRTLLKKSGFDNTLKEVAWMAGLRSDLLSSMDAAAAAASLEGLLMANGYYLARNGFLNQSRGTPGVDKARTLLTAAKQSGMATAVGVTGDLSDLLDKSTEELMSFAADSFVHNDTHRRGTESKSEKVPSLTEGKAN